MKPFILSIAAAACIVLAACEKTTHCAAYDSAILDTWFPYTEGATYHFSTVGGATDTLVINKVDKTGAHSVTWRDAPFNGKELFCETYGKISSKNPKDHPDWIRAGVSHQVSDRTDGGLVAFQLTFENVYVRLEPDVQLNTINKSDSAKYKLTVLENISLNGTAYNGVRLIEPVTPTAGLDKLYIARGKGIIGYRTYPAGVEYWLK